MKKIAFVIPQFPVLSETFVATEIRAMAELGHEVLPIAFEAPQGEYQQHDEPLKMKTHYLCDSSAFDAIKALGYLRPGLSKALGFIFKQQGLSTKSLLGNALKLLYAAKRQGCDHLHAHFAQASAATAIVAARLSGMTVSFAGHGYDVYGTPVDLKLKLDHADFVVAVCEDMCHYLKSISVKANIALIYCGVDMERFKRVQSPSRQPVALVEGDDEPYFQAPTTCRIKKLLFIGRLCPTKGLMTLLKALNILCAQVRPQLDIVGDGELKESLMEYVDAHNLGAQVKFLGVKQTPWLIANSYHYSALVAPFEAAPNGDRDTGPMVIKEAMALKLPVITTYFMGCKEMLTEACSLRIPPNDPVSLAQMLNRVNMMSDQELAAMGDSGYLRVMSLYSAPLQANYLSQMIRSAG